MWENYIEICEDIRHRTGSKDIYAKRKETIERNFGTAKENHAMRYTQQIGKEKMAMKVGLTFACLNIKNLVRILWKSGGERTKKCSISAILESIYEKLKIAIENPGRIALVVWGLSTV